MKKIKILALVSIIFYLNNSNAQTVSTLVASFPGNDGISIDPSGNLYVNVSAQNGTFNGTSVYKVTPDGQATLFSNNLPVFPSGSVFDLNGDLLVTGWSTGTISRIDSFGNHTLVVGGLNTAGGLEIDPLGNIYVSESNSNRVLKFDDQGNNPVVYSSSNLINNSSGLTYRASTGDLYVANWNDGRINVISNSGITTSFVTLPTPNVGTIMNYGGYIFATSPLFNRIYKIHIDTQQVDIFAGTGISGNLDGDISVATFNFPIGVFTVDGDTFYVSETFAGGGRLRKIEGVSLGVDEFTTDNVKIFPNPSSDILNISLHSNNAESIEASIYDINGRLMNTPLPEKALNKIRIDIEELSSGMYFVQLNNINYQNKATVHSFIKK